MLEFIAIVSFLLAMIVFFFTSQKSEVARSIRSHLHRLSIGRGSISGDLQHKPVNENYRSEFVRDVTPDGRVMKTGQIFGHTWEIRNIGSMVWKNRYLARVGPHDGERWLRSTERTLIPYTKPGHSVKVSVELQAPDIPGSYQAEWKMVDRHGRLLLPNQLSLSVSVVVVY